MFSCRSQTTFEHISNLFKTEFVTDESDQEIAYVAEGIYEDFMKQGARLRNWFAGAHLNNNMNNCGLEASFGRLKDLLETKCKLTDLVHKTGEIIRDYSLDRDPTSANW